MLNILAYLILTVGFVVMTYLIGMILLLDRYDRTHFDKLFTGFMVQLIIATVIGSVSAIIWAVRYLAS